MNTIDSRAVLEYRRHLAVQRVHEGYSSEEVATFLGVNSRSVRRWLAAFAQQGEAGLAAQPVSGRPPKLTFTQEKIVLRWLADNPIEHGFFNELWTAPRLVQLIDQEWGIRFNPDYLTTWLRERGFTPQKPQRVPRERDDEAIAAWLAKDWPRIQKKARRRDAYLLLLDESGLLMAPLLRRSWALRGHPPEEKEKAGHREKVSVVAAIWLPPLRDRLGLAFHTLVNGYFDNEAVAAFLDGAVQGFDRPVVVVWDRGTMHKGGPINDLVERTEGRLILERLPPYAPRLNPVEQVWTWLKYSRLNNFAAQDARQLNDAVVRELDAIRYDQQRLRNFFHASLLPLPRTLLS
jgi:putative transposase